VGEVEGEGGDIGEGEQTRFDGVEGLLYTQASGSPPQDRQLPRALCLHATAAKTHFPSRATQAFAVSYAAYSLPSLSISTARLLEATPLEA
jgi:hypothetical protein